MTEKQTLTMKKRAAILSAAIDEFLEKGFKTANMDGIAARAEVSKRTVYNHFASKEILFGAIVEQLQQQKSQSLQFSYDPEMSLEQQLKIVARQELTLLASARFIPLVRMMMAELLGSPKLFEQINQQMNQQTDSLQQWIKDAIDHGQLKPVDVDYAANQFMALIKANAFWPQLFHNRAHPDDATAIRIIDDAVTAFLTLWKND